MSTIFFPSCKMKARFPRQDAALAKYLAERWHIRTEGCCRLNKNKYSADDTAVVICNTCAAIIEESSSLGTPRYAWEYLDADASFPFPDYHGESITVQDCWAAKDRTASQKAVRSLLKKMNFHVVEIPQHGPATDFCGLLLQPILPANIKLAPHQFQERMADQTIRTGADRTAYLEQYQKRFTTERVVCSCRPCNEALKESGVQSVHIIELLFPEP